MRGGSRGGDGLHGIDDRVAGQKNARGRHAFGEQAGARAGRRRKVGARDEIDHAPVHFFGERPGEVAGAQTALDMADAHPAVKCRERGRHRRRRVALHDQPIRYGRDEHGVEPVEDARRQRD